MRVLHVTDCYLPRLGGIEMQVSDLVTAQRAAGHTVEVATATCGDELHGVHRVVARMPFDLPVHPRGVGRLTTLMASWRPDVVHVHVGAVSPFGWMGVRAALRTGMAVVVTVHSMWDPVTRGIYTALKMAFDWHRWGLVATAVSTAAAVPVHAVAGGPVHVIPNGLDLSGWRPTSTTPRSDGEVHLIAVGRLAPRKQPLRLLKLLLIARAAVPPTIPMRATIIGDGPARGSMDRFVAANGMTSWVSMPGRYSRGEVAEVLSTGDIFIAPAPLESFGIAALEARAVGLPIVARSQSGVADFVSHGESGLLGDTFEDMAAAIALLCTDHELRTSIARHNRAVPPAVGAWPAVLDDIMRCYQQAQSRPSTVPHGMKRLRTKPIT
jgi:glycosyltransferase involved in cell wall biosynthesis